MSISDALYPEWDNLLIIPDKVPEVIGVGIDGQMLVVAEKFKGRPRTGRVHSAGPLAPYAPGTRVVFDSHSTFDLSKYGSGEQILLLSSQQVRCVTDGKEADDAPMDESWRDHIKPPPGCVVVQRAELPTMSGSIHKPDSYLDATRSSEAEVLASDDPDGKFVKGDRVFLSGTTAKFIMLGRRGDVVLWIIRPREISGRLLGDPGLIEKKEHVAESDIAHLNELVDSSFGFEEGEARGVR